MADTTPPQPGKPVSTEAEDVLVFNSTRGIRQVTAAEPGKTGDDEDEAGSPLPRMYAERFLPGLGLIAVAKLEPVAAAVQGTDGVEVVGTVAQLERMPSGTAANMIAATGDVEVLQAIARRLSPKAEKLAKAIAAQIVAVTTDPKRRAREAQRSHSIPS